MAADQAKRHELGRQGEEIATAHVSGELTRHKAPFDIVDFNLGVGYEVKTMSGYQADLKINITDNSYQRKIDFATEWGLKMILIAVVIYSPKRVEVYECDLVRCVRIGQMRRVK